MIDKQYVEIYGKVMDAAVENLRRVLEGNPPGTVENYHEHPEISRALTGIENLVGSKAVLIANFSNQISKVEQMLEPYIQRRVA